VAVILVLALAPTVQAAEYPNPSVLATTDYVKSKLNDPNTVLLDVRDAADYEEGHIPGAVNLGGKAWKVLRDSTARVYTVTAEDAALLGDAGISDTNEIIVYGALEKKPYHFTVAYWILEYLGAKNVKFYPGGIDEWVREGNEVKTGVETRPPTTFNLNTHSDRIVSTDWLIKNYNSPSVYVIDVRTPKEYSGKDCKAIRCGHIPGAHNIDTKHTLYNRTTWQLLPVDDLLKNYADVPKDKDLVLHCQTATRTSYTYFVLRLLGYDADRIKIYDDSWRVWGSRQDTPIENEQWYNFAALNKEVKKIKDVQSLATQALVGVEEAKAGVDEAKAGVEEAKKVAEETKGEAIQAATQEISPQIEESLSAAQNALEAANTVAAEKAGRGQVFGAYVLAILAIVVAVARRS